MLDKDKEVWYNTHNPSYARNMSLYKTFLRREAKLLESKLESLSNCVHVDQYGRAQIYNKELYFKQPEVQNQIKRLAKLRKDIQK